MVYNEHPLTFLYLVAILLLWLSLSRLDGGQKGRRFQYDANRYFKSFQGSMKALWGIKKKKGERNAALPYLQESCNAVETLT